MSIHGFWTKDYFHEPFAVLNVQNSESSAVSCRSIDCCKAWKETKRRESEKLPVGREPRSLENKMKHGCSKKFWVKVGDESQSDVSIITLDITFPEPDSSFIIIFFLPLSLLSSSSYSTRSRDRSCRKYWRTSNGWTNCALVHGEDLSQAWSLNDVNNEEIFCKQASHQLVSMTRAQKMPFKTEMKKKPRCFLFLFHNNICNPEQNSESEHTSASSRNSALCLASRHHELKSALCVILLVCL